MLPFLVLSVIVVVLAVASYALSGTVVERPSR